jgi:hypothetical protein
LNQRGRDSSELSQWRKQVYLRNNFTCQQCGYHGRSLHAHHIKSYSDYPELRFDISNGLTVCISCHEKLHGRKLSSPAKYPKHCCDCGKPTSGKSPRCRSCGGRFGHIALGHIKPRQCLQCGKQFVARSDYKLCSAECRQLYQSKAKPIHCDQCGTIIMRPPSGTKKHNFCTEHCQHLFARKRVDRVCPICGASFTVKAYRVRDGKIPTCSKTCGYKSIALRRAQSTLASTPNFQGVAGTH